MRKPFEDMETWELDYFIASAHQLLEEFELLEENLKAEEQLKDWLFEAELEKSMRLRRKVAS